MFSSQSDLMQLEFMGFTSDKIRVKRVNYTYVFYCLIVLLVSCKSEKADVSISQTNIKLTNIPSSDSGLEFVNTVSESAFRNSMFYDYFLNGSGVAVGDINNDNLPDIFFTGNDTSNKLYLNKGNLKFEDISTTAFDAIDVWSTGANMVDVNNDGFLDIYVCNSGMESDPRSKANLLYINNGDLTFREDAASYGLDDKGYSIHSSFFDYDRDGDLDLWVSNHINYDGNLKGLTDNMGKTSPSRKIYRSALYRNDGQQFIDVSDQAGISRESASLGIATSDLNDDGWIDIYVSNDYDVPDYYFVNQGDGTFADMSKQLLGHTSFYSMGVDAADINNDLLLDLMAVDMTPKDHVRNKVLMASMDVGKFNFLYDHLGFTPSYMFNSLQLARGGGYFSEVGNYMGISQTEWSWAPLILDLDNDGWKDIYVTNGYLRDTKDNDFKRKVEEYKLQHGGEWNEEVYAYFQEIIKSTPISNVIFENNKGKFEDVSTQSTDMPPSFSNGAAYADFDLDGDLDIVINNLSQKVSLLRNDSPKSNYLRIRLFDDRQPASVSNAVVYLTTESGRQRLDYTFSRGYESSVEPILHFGLGDHSTVNHVEVFWLDGSYSEMSNVKANQVLTINKSSSKNGKPRQASSKPYLNDVTSLLNGAEHVEMKFNDFEKEVLLPHKYSDLGPALAVGDVNNDGLDDIFLGGSNTSEPQLLIQSDNGFKNLPSVDILNDRKYEDLGAKFIDIDGDNDLDLYVASGGGGEIVGHEKLNQDRLYINDGKGNFTKQSQEIPPIGSSTKAILTGDYDSDGDVDLLVAGRNTPGGYPATAKSYYLENNGSFFREKFSKMFAEGTLDMVSSMDAGDLDGDGELEIMAVGEWSEPIIFKKNGNVYSKRILPACEGKVGWWQAVKIDDIDGDGDNDVILGNMGENNKFHPSKEKPLGLLFSDFDDSGTFDIVLTKKYKDETVPVRGKECSSVQMPLIKEKFPSYEGFATSSIEEILGEEKIEKAYKREATDFTSYILINDGKGNFDVNRLPSIAQYAPITGIEIIDITGDGKKDIVIVGNKKNAEPETPAYDASYGLVLIQKGVGIYDPIGDWRISGLMANQDARAVESIRLFGDKRGLVIANNNGLLQLYTINN